VNATVQRTSAVAVTLPRSISTPAATANTLNAVA
jgi:hypothetical protein